MKIENSDVKNSQILKRCFDQLVLLGLERTSMRDLCEATNLSASSLYYRFENKDEIIMEATYSGLVNISKELFWLAVTKMTNFTELFSTIISNVDLRKSRLRLIYQVATSPKYGDIFRQKSLYISELYNTYAGMISEHFCCSSDKLMPYIHLFISAIRGYTIWGNKCVFENELRYIYFEISNYCVNTKDKEKQMEKTSVCPVCKGTGKESHEFIRNDGERVTCCIL